MAKSASDLLIDYGYTEVSDGLFVPGRPSSERWEKVDGGFNCYVPAAAGINGGDPWGKVLEGGLMQVPFTQTEAYKDASGLHPARQPEAFEWVWPEERVVEIYAHTAGANGNEWVRNEDGKIVKAKT